jgi:integrase
LKKDQIARNVAALTTGPKVERAPLKPLSVEGAQRLLEIVSGHRLEALFVMALSVAMRRGEILGLKWGNINMDARELTVEKSLQRVGGSLKPKRKSAGAPDNLGRPGDDARLEGSLELLPLKTESSARAIRLPEHLFAALKRRRTCQKEEQLAAGPDWQDNPHDLVFTSLRGTPVDPRNVVRMFKIALAKAGLPDVRFHDLRHTRATLLFKNGAHPKQVQALLGHSRVGTTLDIYTHVDSSTLDDTANRINAILGAVKARA